MANKNTPKAKGFRTAYQAVVGAVIAYVTGLVALPEVREYTTAFLRNEGAVAFGVVLAACGVSAGLVAFVQNRLGR